MRDRESGRLRQRDQPSRVNRDAELAGARQDADRQRTQERARAVAEKIRAMERQHPCWCHADREHLRATDEQLALRAKTGRNTRGEPGRPVDATRWQDPESLGRAFERLKDSDQFRRRHAAAQVVANRDPSAETRFAVAGRLSDVLGPDWQQHVYGRSRASRGQHPCQWGPDSRAVAVWQRQNDGKWHLYTCYPQADSRSFERQGIQTI